MTLANRLLAALVLSTVPETAYASGCMLGAYVAFFLLWILPCVSAIAVALGLRGTWGRRIGSAVLSMPAVAAVFFVMSLGLTRAFVKDSPACSVWPEIVGAIVALAIPVFVIRNGNRTATNMPPESPD